MIRALARRAALLACLVPSLGFVASESAFAQAPFPSRIIRVVVPYSAGGVVDLFARSVVDEMKDRFSQPFIVEAQPGANSNLAIGNVSRSDPDGHTWLITTPSFVANPTLYGNLPWTAQKDFTSVGIIGYSPNVLVVDPKLPVRTVAELVKLAKSKPGDVSFGFSGGSSLHYNLEAFKQEAGIEVLMVPYKGAPPIAQDMLGGNVAAAFLPASVAAPFTQSGQLRALAVVSDTALDLFPDVPTIAASGYPATGLVPWYGLAVRRGTPQGVIERINRELNAAIATKAVQDRLLTIGGVAAKPMSLEEIAAFTSAESERYMRLIRTSNMKP